MRLDLLFLAWNRREFTTATWAWMIAHTDWERVSKLIVYDDGSDDGTYEFLKEAVAEHDGMNGGLVAELRQGRFHSPPAVMNHYIGTAESDVFAKIDSDIALPGGWLEAMLSVWFGTHTKIDLLGMEAGWTELPGRDGKEWDRTYHFTEGSHIGGVGLMRTDTFRRNPPIFARGRDGFTQWQERFAPVRGWITPDLMVPQLDRIPEEPWLSLSEQYVENGWQREWGKYSERWMEPYWIWTRPVEVDA